jgi:hypothetical protein
MQFWILAIRIPRWARHPWWVLVILFVVTLVLYLIIVRTRREKPVTKRELEDGLRKIGRNGIAGNLLASNVAVRLLMLEFARIVDGSEYRLTDKGLDALTGLEAGRTVPEICDYPVQ